METRNKIYLPNVPKCPQDDRSQTQETRRGWPMFRIICKVLYFVGVYYSYLWLYTNYRETLSDILASLGNWEFVTAFDKIRIWLRLYRVPQCPGGYVHDGSYMFKDLECVTPFISS
ncbi:uncharacterized protein LOC106653710 [Trichogramma pretiosum]|uniref:uncharacterized protein LOC106653710 n=1 Tax=Trichogramma pretiosum TaxID=7493 RepID=UPI0006C986FF|nr:uncharacterized protein LOC106653710 [Trichogramma pretiosum]